jgi:DNA-binding PadR family transcriptional regulator
MNQYNETRKSNLTLRYKLIFLALKNTMTKEQLSDFLDINVGTVYDNLKRMRALGYITVVGKEDAHTLYKAAEINIKIITNAESSIVNKGLKVEKIENKSSSLADKHYIHNTDNEKFKKLYRAQSQSFRVERKSAKVSPNSVEYGVG